MDYAPLNDATSVLVNVLTTATIVVPVVGLAVRKIRAELREQDARMKHAIATRPPVQNSGEVG